MRSLFSLILAAILATTSLAAPAAFDHTHAALDALLRKHVKVIDGGRNSQVNYTELAKSRVALKNYLAGVSGVTASEFGGWSKAQQMAFLINAYNAFTVELVLTRYPDIKSIRDLGNIIFNSPWKQEFFTLFGTKSYLDQIEHEILRKPGSYDEPRVHFAVNCASIGCPMLREEAYVAARLDAQLEEQARRFLSDRSRNRYDAGRNELQVSKIFDWYSKDWTSGYRGFEGRTPPIHSLDEYFARYAQLLGDAPGAWPAFGGRMPVIRFLEYDWSLNDVKQ